MKEIHKETPKKQFRLPRKERLSKKFNMVCLLLNNLLSNTSFPFHAQHLIWV